MPHRAVLFSYTTPKTISASPSLCRGASLKESTLMHGEESFGSSVRNYLAAPVESLDRPE
jgi:hypothetical protein